MSDLDGTTNCCFSGVKSHNTDGGSAARSTVVPEKSE